MKRIAVIITEVLTRTVWVEAESENSALGKVQDKYNEAEDDDYILTADDLEDVTFNVVSNEEEIEPNEADWSNTINIKLSDDELALIIHCLWHTAAATPSQSVSYEATMLERRLRLLQKVQQTSHDAGGPDHEWEYRPAEPDESDAKSNTREVDNIDELFWIEILRDNTMMLHTLP